MEREKQDCNIENSYNSSELSSSKLSTTLEAVLVDTETSSDSNSSLIFNISIDQHSSEADYDKLQSQSNSNGLPNHELPVRLPCENLNAQIRPVCPVSTGSSSQCDDQSLRQDSAQASLDSDDSNAASSFNASISSSCKIPPTISNNCKFTTHITQSPHSPSASTTDIISHSTIGDNSNFTSFITAATFTSFISQTNESLGVSNIPDTRKDFLASDSNTSSTGKEGDESFITVSQWHSLCAPSKASSNTGIKTQTTFSEEDDRPHSPMSTLYISAKQLLSNDTSGSGEVSTSRNVVQPVSVPTPPDLVATNTSRRSDQYKGVNRSEGCTSCSASKSYESDSMWNSIESKNKETPPRTQSIIASTLSHSDDSMCLPRSAPNTKYNSVTSTPRTGINTPTTVAPTFQQTFPTQLTPISVNIEKCKLKEGYLSRSCEVPPTPFHESKTKPLKVSNLCPNITYEAPERGSQNRRSFRIKPRTLSTSSSPEEYEENYIRKVFRRISFSKESSEHSNSSTGSMTESNLKEQSNETNTSSINSIDENMFLKLKKQKNTEEVIEWRKKEILKEMMEVLKDEAPQTIQALFGKSSSGKSDPDTIQPGLALQLHYEFTKYLYDRLSVMFANERSVQQELGRYYQVVFLKKFKSLEHCLELNYEQQCTDQKSQQNFVKNLMDKITNKVGSLIWEYVDDNRSFDVSRVMEAAMNIVEDISLQSNDQEKTLRLFST